MKSKLSSEEEELNQVLKAEHLRGPQMETVSVSTYLLSLLVSNGCAGPSLCPSERDYLFGL